MECDVIECFRVRETGRVYCLAVDSEGRVYIARVDFGEDSWDELPESIQKAIEELEKR